MEALLDFFDPTDSQPVVSPRSSLTTKQPLPKSLPPEVCQQNILAWTIGVKFEELTLLLVSLLFL